MLFELMNAYAEGGEALKMALASLLLSIPIIFLAISVHETAHGFVAYKLGDPTAKSLGRLTLNPAKHFDPIGFICMLLFRFGWAKPVPVNTRYFKKPKTDMLWCALAGPASNIILAVIFAVLLRIAAFVQPYVMGGDNYTSWVVYTLIIEFFDVGIRMNIAFAIFNLIPVPPFDGSRILFAFAPDRLYYKMIQYERYIYLGTLLLLFTGILDNPLSFLTDLIYNLIISLLFLF